jgi:putative flavoprotein involved in K+ transport
MRLLTPNWLTRLPEYRYEGSDPDGYMTAGEVADFVRRYADVVRAPVRTGVNVTSVRPDDAGYHVLTSAGEFRARTVVIASGACNKPSLPAFAPALPESVEQLTALDYRDPAKLPDGGVLVVGASATGVQVAAEIARSGRPVTLSVGEHVRLPRTYRGRDVMWWMDAAGPWDQRYDELDDLNRARRLPSPQLIGTPERETLDLNALTSMGVELVGRWATVRDGRALFSGGLRNVFALADLKLGRLLETFDGWVRTQGRDAEVEPPERFPATRVPESARLQLDLAGGEIRSVVWATGYRPDYDWLNVPVVDAKGQLDHEGGVVASPGMYALGLPVLRRRRSTFMCGIEDDAHDVIDHLTGHLTARP